MLPTLLGNGTTLGPVLHSRLPGAAGQTRHASPSASDQLRARIAHALEPRSVWRSRDGRPLPAANLGWAGALHERWLAAFPADDSLAAPDPWLLDAPVSMLGMQILAADQAWAALGGVPAGPAVDGVRPQLADDGLTASRVQLAVAVHRAFPETGVPALPIPVLGARSPSEVFLSESDIGLADAFETAGVAVIDPRPLATLPEADRGILTAILHRAGVRQLTAYAALDACDLHRPVEPDPTWDSAALRVAAWATPAAGAALAQAWGGMFWSIDRWIPETSAPTTLAIWRARTRVPSRAGPWLPVADLSLAEDLPDALRVDVSRIADLLGLSGGDAASLLERLGCWKGVPICLRFAIPWADRARRQREIADLQARFPRDAWDSTAPATPARTALFGFCREELRCHHPDRADAPTVNTYSRPAECTGGFLPYLPVRPLAQADLPNGADETLSERIIAEGDWLDFTDVPLHQARDTYFRTCPRGWFPSCVTLRLRSTLVRPTYAKPPSIGPSEPCSGLFRLRSAPRDPGGWANSAARALPLVFDASPTRDRENDALHILAVDRLPDLRHIVKALHALRARWPDASEPGLDAAVKDVMEQAKTMLDHVEADGRTALADAAHDAAALGWVGADDGTVERIPVLCRVGHDRRWVRAGQCRAERVFFDNDRDHASRRAFREEVGFAELFDSRACAEALDVPIFELVPCAYDVVAEDPEQLCQYLCEVVAELLPWVRDAVTARAAAGGNPMKTEVFDRRADRALVQPRFERVSAWPTSQALVDPPGSRVPLGRADLMFRYDDGPDGPRFLVDARVRSIADARRSLWRLDVPIALAVGSAGHAPHIQNLLRAWSPEWTGAPEDNPGLVDLVGGPMLPTADEDDPKAPPEATRAAPSVRLAFTSHIRRASALVLHCASAADAANEARTCATEPGRFWSTAVGKELLERDGQPLTQVLLEVFGLQTVEGEDAGLRLEEAASGLPGFDEVLRLLEGEQEKWGGRTFASAEEAIVAWSEWVDGLAVPDAEEAVAVDPVPPTGRRGGGGSQFAGRGTVTGQLAERFAARALARRFPGARVAAVATEAERTAATLPEGYGPRPANVSPGVDFLVFLDGQALPLGVEVKGRVGDGPVNFPWTRNEAWRCREVGKTLDWPLADYAALVVSDLEPRLDRAPHLRWVPRDTLLVAAEPDGWVVRVG